MNERSGSPEIDVVGSGDHSEMFNSRTGRLYLESTNWAHRRNPSHSANENGANRLAANTNNEGKQSETVNLRVRNMGFITVKKEPESEDDNEGGYSLSSLLEECDFDKTPRRRALKSPTSLALSKPKPMEESARPAPSSQGRPRQSLENVISSLKSARAMSDNKPTPISRPVTMRPQIVSAPTPVFSSPGTNGPQIVDVRSLASVARPPIKQPVPIRGMHPAQYPMSMGSALNAGHPRRCAANSATSVPNSNTPASATAQATVIPSTKPVNIRFVLPANVPFSTEQFQQVLQATLASVASSTKVIEPNQLQQAIQAALTSVTKSTVAFNPEQLQEAIKSSLAAAGTGSAPISQVKMATLSPTAVYLPRGTQRQPQTIAPKPPPLPQKLTVMRVETSYGSSDPPSVVSLPPASVASAVAVTQPSNNSLPAENDLSNNQSSSESITNMSTNLSTARDALIKALQENRVLNSPASCTISPPSASLASSAVTSASADTESFDFDSYSPPSSPVPPVSVSSADESGQAMSCSNSSLTGSTPLTTTVATPLATTVATPSTTSVATPLATTVATPLTTSVATPLATTVATPLTTSVATPLATTVATPLTTTVATPLTTTVANSSNANALDSQKVSTLPQGNQLSTSTSVSERVLEPSNRHNSITPMNGNPTAKIATSSKAENANSPSPLLVPSATSMAATNTTSVNLQITLPVNITPEPVSISSVKKPTGKGNKPAPTGCGCCSNCKNVPVQDKDTYDCNHKGCGAEYTTLRGLRTHHYYHPTHKPLFPVEKAANSVEYFLPSELANCHRSARLRELLKQLTNEELKEIFLPRVAKTFSLFELLEMKSVRANTPRGQVSVSAFKMYSEFERFRKEVENRLMELIMLPQGKGGFVTEKKKEAGKDIPAVNTAKSDTKPESSPKQPLTVSDSSSSNSSVTKEKAETIVIDDTEGKQSTVAAVTESLKNGISAVKSSPSHVDISSGICPNVCEGEKTTKGPTSVEKKSDDSASESGQKKLADKESKQSDTLAQSAEKGSEAVNSAKPYDEKSSESEQVTPTESSAVTVTKDSTSEPMETDQLQRKEVSTAENEKQKSPSTDVIMVDAEEKIEPVNKESHLLLTGEDGKNGSKTPVLNADENKLKVSTEKGKQFVISSGEEKSQGKKQVICVEEEHKGETPAVGKQSVVAEKEKSMQAVNDQAVDAVKDLGNDSNSGSNLCKTKDVTVVESTEKNTAGSGNKKAPQVSLTTDKDSKDNSDQKKVLEEGCKDTDIGGKETSNVSKLNEENNESKEQATTQTLSQEPSEKVIEEEKPGSSCAVPPNVDLTDSSSSDTQTEASSDSPLLSELKRRLIAYSIDEDEGINESNLLEFGLPFAVKWGKVIKKVETVEARKITRRENYTDQDMRQFIYSKPKDAANVVVSADCHAHPSFYRAYVMPALLDKHIDDFGLFGRKILSGLNLSRKKYVDVLRSSIGPELAKIVGINIFPTFKRIMDTWEMVKGLPPGGTVKTPLVLIPRPEDGRDVPDDENEPAPTTTMVGRTVTNVQNAVTRVSDASKRLGPPGNELNGNNKRPRLDTSDVPKDTTETSKTQNDSSARIVPQPNITEKGRKPDSTDSTSTGKEQQSDSKSQPAESNKSQNGQSASEKPATGKGSGDSGTGSSSSTDASRKEPAVSSTSGATASSSQSKPSTTSSPPLVIPKKATIYTSETSKAGGSPLPLSSAKGSPLYLVPVEKLSPKLVEQFLNQAKGDGVKTRSSSSAKKPKQAKQGSQVFVLIPPSNPSGSPTIQTLTSEEQLEGSGDKKPLLLLPADKVPKTMASQSPTVRRKMLITVMSSRENTSTAQSAAKQSMTTTSAASAGDQQKPDSAVQSITSPIMSTQESDSNIGTTATEHTKEVTTDVPPPNKESPDTSVKSLVSVVNNTSALSSSSKDSSGEDTTGHPSSVPDEVNQSEGKISEHAEPELKESTESSESAASSSGDTNTPTDPCGKTQASSTSASADSMDREETGGLEFLGSSLLPSDMTLDNLLKDLTGNSSGGETSAIPPLNISEVISSFGEVPDESSATVTDDAVTSTVQGAACDSDTETRSSSQGSSVGDDNNLATRRQSPRRGLSATKLTPVSSLAETSSPNTSEASDNEDGSPPRKRRKTPTRSSVRSFTQVTFVPDKDVAGKASISKTKARK